MEQSQPVLDTNSLTQYAIFLNSMELRILKNVLKTESFSMAQEKFGMRRGELESKYRAIKGRLERIVSRCSDPAAAYKRPLGAPIEILQLPPVGVESKLRDNRLSNKRIDLVADLFIKRLTAASIRKDYLISEEDVNDINERLEHLNIPQLAENNPNKPIYDFFSSDNGLNSHQEALLLNVRWGNVSREEFAQERNMPPNRVDYQIESAMNELRRSW